MQGFGSLRNKKAASLLDKVSNEHLKCGIVLAPRWTTLYDKCLRFRTLPTQWRDATQLVIFKGKDNQPPCHHDEEYRREAFVISCSAAY